MNNLLLRRLLSSIAVAALFSTSAVNADYKDPMKLQSQIEPIQKELQSIVADEINKLQSQVQVLGKAKAPREKQLKLLSRISTLQNLLDLDEQAKDTDKKQVDLLKGCTSKTEKRQLIGLTLNHAYSRRYFQTDQQEVQCKMTLKQLLTDVAGSDPCLQVQVLSRWIGWFPWLTPIRNKLIDALLKCNDTDQEDEKIKMVGYLWASGFQYTNHILFQPPKRPEFLRKAFEAAVLAKDADSVVSISSILSDKSVETQANKGSDSPLPNQRERFLIAFKILGENANRDGGKFQIVSNRVRNEIVSYALEAEPADAIAVIEAWMNLLKKVPGDPAEFPEDSGSELIRANLMRGALESMLGKYEQSQRSYDAATTGCASFKKEIGKPIDLKQLREQSILRLKKCLMSDFESEPYALSQNPIGRLSMLQFAHDRISGDFTDSVQTAATVGSATIKLKQHQPKDAIAVFKRLSEQTKTDRLHLPQEQMIAGLGALIASTVASTNPTEANSYFQQSYDLYFKFARGNDPRAALDSFRRGIEDPEWPPMCIPPSRGIPRSNSEEIVLRALPDKEQFCRDYAAFLSKHKTIAGASDRLKLLEKQVESDKVRARRHEIANKLYAIDIEENQIANLMETDPQGAIERLRAIIEKRREIGFDVSRMLCSLSALGNALNTLGEVREAIPPLEQALKLGEKLEVKRRDEFLVKPKSYLAESLFQQGEYQKAADLLSALLVQLDADKSMKYRAADTRVLQAFCLVYEDKLLDAQSAIEMAEKAFVNSKIESANWRARIARAKAEMYLHMKEPKKAMIQSHISAEQLQKALSEFDSNKQEEAIDKLVAAGCCIESEDFDKAKEYLDVADDAIEKLPGSPKSMKLRVCELRAKLAVAQKNLPEARTEYQKAIAIINETIGPCPRMDKLQNNLNELKR